MRGENTCKVFHFCREPKHTSTFTTWTRCINETQLKQHVSVTVLSSKVRRNIDGDHFLMATRLMHDNHCIFPRITVMRITKQTNSRWRALARRSAAKNDTFYGYKNMNTYNASIYNIYWQHIINTMVRLVVHCHVFIRV